MKIFKDKDIKSIIWAIKKGKVLICPTDTVYGLICDASNKKAVERVFKIKQRKKSKPLPIFVKNIVMARKLAEIDKNQEIFLKRAWPGKITAVLKLKTQLKVYGIAKNTIALRIPDHKIIRCLLKAANLPLIGTSANISGQPASGNIKEVLGQFERKKQQPDLAINAGNLPESLSSKIIDLTVWPPKILRS